MIVGYILAMAPKKARHDFSSTMAQAKDGGDKYLLRDRGATLFKSKDEATEALRQSLLLAQFNGHEWPKQFRYEIVEVRDAHR